MKIKTTLIGILGAGLSLSLLFSGLTLKYELTEAEKVFSDKVNRATEFARQKLHQLSVTDERLRFLFQVNEKVSEDDFLVLSESIFAQSPYIIKMAYAPKIRLTHVNVEEQKLQNKGYTGFRFRAFSGALGIQSQYQEFIYPIRLIQPYTPYTSVWFGRDLLTFKPTVPVLSKLAKGKKMQVSRALLSEYEANMRGDNTTYYAFSAVSYNGDQTEAEPQAFETVFGVLIYEIDFVKLLADSDLKDVGREITFNDEPILSQQMLTKTGFLNIQRMDTVPFEEQNFTIRYQFLDPLRYMDFKTAFLILILGFILTILLVIAVKNALERQKLLKDQNRLIEAKVQEKTALLETQAEQLRLAFDHQLAVTQELESFSYSISHDLRAPLRAIGGFANVLSEDYSDVLDAEGKDLLSRVERGATKMSVLIDDLLNLSKITRQSFTICEFSITDLVNEQVSELCADGFGKHTHIIVAENLNATGDRNLVRIVLNNLVSNAIKYSSKMVSPTVEFGAFEQDGKQVYFVKDNGVGFDMTYANKLFVAFQRLHGSDFEGTGIGLATVQRIVNRHGGKIWAESQPGKGATFYFTLR